MSAVAVHQPLPGMGTPAVASCARCGRTLTDPVSIAQDFGSVCIGYVRRDDAAQRGPQMIDPFDPQTMDITCRRLPRKGEPAVFNILQRHRHHSPTGMEYGYLGSGPADLALNVLALFLPIEGKPRSERSDDDVAMSAPNAVALWDGTAVSNEAWNLHQRFKEAFVAALPHAGGTIPGDAIRHWISQKLEAAP